MFGKVSEFDIFIAMLHQVTRCRYQLVQMFAYIFHSSIRLITWMARYLSSNAETLQNQLKIESPRRLGYHASSRKTDGRFNMQAGDMVYYLFTDQYGVETKIPARVLSASDDEVTIRIGRYDVHTKEVKLMESGVAPSNLLPRRVRCSYEDELLAG